MKTIEHDQLKAGWPKMMQNIQSLSGIFFEFIRGKKASLLMKVTFCNNKTGRVMF